MSVKAMREAEPQSQMSDDDFHALEEKVYRAIELLKAARQARNDAEREAARLREQMRTHTGETESLRRELIELRREREQIKVRVEKMLNQVDSLTGESAGR